MPAAIEAQGVTILGATGSIGVSTLDVLSRHPERYRIVALTANNQVERLLDQCRRFRPETAVMCQPDAAVRLERRAY
jgi:1-deoxy-D-xylulose-5-phosphate reductoisomerase